MLDPPLVGPCAGEGLRVLWDHMRWLLIWLLLLLLGSYIHVWLLKGKL